MSWKNITVLVFISICAAGAAQLDTLSGSVRDAKAAPVADAVVSLSGPQGILQQTKTGPSGQYHFAAVANGDYTLKAEAHGSVANANVHLPAATSFDLVLMPSTAATEHPKLQLQASGLHGLIDPGGYSASASADAASGLVHSIADLKRTAFRVPVPANLPCSLGPRLKIELATNPNDELANRRLGEFYVAHEEPSLAIPLLHRALELDSADAGATRALATAQMQSGDFESARKLLAVLAAKDDTAATHQLLAKAYEGLANFQQAAQEYRTADRETPSEESVLGLGYELILAGSPADALTVFLSGGQRNASSVALRIGVGTAQFLLGHAAESVISFLSATSIDPVDPRPYPFLSAASGVSSAEHERVRNAFKRYLERMPNSAAANYYYAVDLSRDSTGADESNVETLLKRAVQLDDTLAKAHLLLADSYARGKQFEAAIPEYERTLQLEPQQKDAHYKLALAYKRAGRAEDSTREMQKFQQASSGGNPGSADADINLAQFVSVMNPPEDTEVRCAASPN